MWKQACTARDNSCQKTFDTDCATVTTRVDWFGDEVYDVPNICVPGEGCVRGPVPIYERKESLQVERKLLQADSQQLTELYQQAAAFCLGTLVDPTGVVALAASTQDISTNSPETNALMQQVVDSPGGTQTSIRCKLEERLRDVDMPVIQRKLDILLSRIQEVDKLTDIVDRVQKK